MNDFNIPQELKIGLTKYEITFMSMSNCEKKEEVKTNNKMWESIENGWFRSKYGFVYYSTKSEDMFYHLYLYLIPISFCDDTCPPTIFFNSVKIIILDDVIQ